MLVRLSEQGQLARSQETVKILMLSIDVLSDEGES